MFIEKRLHQLLNPVGVACLYSHLNLGSSRMTRIARILRVFGDVVPLAPAGRYVYNLNLKINIAV